VLPARRSKLWRPQIWSVWEAMRFGDALVHADARDILPTVVHVWRMAHAQLIQDVSRKSSGVLSTQVMILGVLDPPNT
jgi:hypothetical protein